MSILTVYCPGCLGSGYTSGYDSEGNQIQVQCEDCHSSGMIDVVENSDYIALEAELATLHSRLEFTSCQKADVEAQVLELEEQNAALRRDKLRLVNACEVECIGLAGVTNGEDPRLAIEAAGAACCRAMQGVGMPDGLEEVVASLEAENETLREDAEVIHEIREIIQSFNEKMKVPPYSLVHGGLDNYQTAITGISAALEAAGLIEEEGK